MSRTSGANRQPVLPAMITEDVVTQFRVMTVCTGNICRSPMAEVVLRAALAEAGLDEAVSVRSTAVTGEEVGNPIDHRADRVLRRAGFQVPVREATRVVAHDVAQTDLALAMTAQHARALRRLGFPEEKVVLFRAFEAGVPHGPPHEVEAPDTPDPWYGGPEDFEECLATIVACTPGIVEYVGAQVASRR